MTEKLKTRLIPDWRKAWRLWSVRLNALGLAILGWVTIDPVGVLYVWNLMPPQVRAMLPENFLTFAGLALFALSMLARIVRQPKLEQTNAG
ncbi:hypothetical protein Pan3_24 [Pseudanabaena phage Pan3]|nr:hypothetical protein Pan3_24 [Pseudanabaena phage Pan3]